MLEVGLRVVRGPDWTWGPQDDGEGHCGTVVELGKPGSNTPNKTVVVQWDSGSRTNYRVGYDDRYDLRVFDNAPAGVKHQNIICDGCKKHGIVGMRWKCVRCYDYDLCTHCYMADKHDLTHVFQRFETASSSGVEMGPRKGCVKIQLKGIFVGAKVVRGADWDWNNQDGGEGKTGRVIDIRGWDNESGRSVANVTWTSGSTNVYRLGHKGKVDLKYAQGQEAVGGFYYRDHLPVLGKGQDQQVGACRLPGSPRHLTFNVGDKVMVRLDVETLKHMQEGHGGWNPRMAEFIGKIGIVHRVTDRGDIRVQYEGCNNRWTFHPGTLTKIHTFAVGDVVRVKHDLAQVRDYQKGHGEWIEVMKSALGKLGKVIKIYTDGDLRVCIEGKTWTFNPLCVTLVPGSATELNNTMHANQQREEHASPLASLLSNLVLCPQLDSSSMDKLVREAAQGHLEIVRDFVQKFPDQVDGKSSGKTCLQVACHQGHMELVLFLLSAGASLQVADNEGDTALHYSAFGNQPEIMEVLLQKGADKDATNKGKCSSLHVAVNKQHARCVAALLKFKCDVNTQDSYGDTALHDAIGKDSLEIIDMLCNVPGVDFTLKNKRGFNVLHHAALKGNNFATERLLCRTRQLVDVKKDDGFAALHLACLNGHRAVAETLLAQGQAEVDLRNNRKQTPLLLAVSQGHCAVVELVVSMSANVHAEDEDGDTGLHLALMKRASITTDINELEAPIVYGIYSQLAGRCSEHLVALAIACYLVQEGCQLAKRNSKGRSALDLVAGTPMVDLLQQYVTSRSGPQNPAGDAAAATREEAPLAPREEEEEGEGVEEAGGTEKRARPPAECAVCSELGDENVLFEPCGHKVACEDCSSRMKKCLKCGQVVTKRITQDGRTIACKSRQPSTERMRYLESKIAEIEEAHSCSICMERRRNVAFLCGHGSCEKCSTTLKTCHMCRKTITKKINLY
ncbi:E3 ubiquitin-protein ligase MIB2 [Bacillus rossius redtenbacheri]|uniref:E3 ubiquitin-protein ligase MIB2 n=1 Tax=Bacillus rossius redtenbacheri TaxID=93214 RepID=UPI002FDECB39